ncbi:MAG: hypothetical protein ABEI39_00545 [Halobacteriales archaeon]
MLALSLDAFAVEFKDGTVNTVGAPNKAATAKLYDVTESEARAFGDERVKLAFADDEGNEVEVALPPEAADAIAETIGEVELE